MLQTTALEQDYTLFTRPGRLGLVINKSGRCWVCPQLWEIASKLQVFSLETLFGRLANHSCQISSMLSPGWHYEELQEALREVSKQAKTKGISLSTEFLRPEQPLF